MAGREVLPATTIRLPFPARLRVAQYYAIGTVVVGGIVFVIIPPWTHDATGAREVGRGVDSISQARRRETPSASTPDADGVVGSAGSGPWARSVPAGSAHRISAPRANS